MGMMRSAASATTSATVMPADAGSERASTWPRKPPLTRSWLGSSASTNDGMPMMAAEMSDICMGMKGYGGKKMHTNARTAV